MNIKNTILLSALPFFFVACDPIEKYEPPTPVSKKIIMKECPIEQRVGFDFFSKDPIRQKSQTIYYLIAEDGTCVEVGLSEYATTQIGSSFSSLSWHNK